MAGVTMPDDIAGDPVQREVWESVAPKGRNRFREEDVPLLRMLCYWHAVARECRRDLARGIEPGRVAVMERIGSKPYRDSSGNTPPLFRKNPLLGILKEASAEIRAISDQLGISPRTRAETAAAPKVMSRKAQILDMAKADREAKARRAAGA